MSFGYWKINGIPLTSTTVEVIPTKATTSRRTRQSLVDIHGGEQSRQKVGIDLPVKNIEFTFLGADDDDRHDEKDKVVEILDSDDVWTLEAPSGDSIFAYRTFKRAAFSTNDWADDDLDGHAQAVLAIRATVNGAWIADGGTYEECTSGHFTLQADGTWLRDDGVNTGSAPTIELPAQSPGYPQAVQASDYSTAVPAFVSMRSEVNLEGQSVFHSTYDLTGFLVPTPSAPGDTGVYQVCSSPGRTFLAGGVDEAEAGGVATAAVGEGEVALGDTASFTDPGVMAHFAFDETEGNVGSSLIVNGDFTTYTTSPGVPDNWSAIGAGAGVTVARETTNFFTGPNASRITCDWTLASLAATHGFEQTITGLVTGKSYFFRIRVHLLDALEAGVTLVCKLRNQTDGVDLSSSSTPAGVLVGQWATVSGTFMVADATDIHRIQCGFFKNSGTGTTGSDSFDIDAISVQEIRATDHSGKGNHGIIEGDANTLGPTIGVAGKSGTAYDLDGTNDRVRVPDNATLRSESFSILAWVNPDQIRTQGIFGKRIVDASHWAARVFMTASGAIEVDSSASGSTEVGNAVSTPTVLSIGAWSHLAATYHKPTQVLRLYIAGVLVKEVTGVADMFWDQAGVAGTDIQWGFTATNRLDGKIDRGRILDHALTAAEVAADALAF